MQKKFQKWLFIFISIAFLVTLTLSYFIQTRTAYKNAELIISLKIEDIKKEILTNQENLKTIRHESDSEAINKAKTLAWLLYSRPEIEKEQDTLVELLKILNVDEIDITNEKGIIVNSTTPIHLGFDMNSTSQSQWFMQLLENPDLELVQDPLPRGSDGKIMQFAGVALLNKPGFVQISYSSERLQKAMDLANIENIAHGFRIGKNGTAILVKQDKIVSIENPKWLNKNIKDLGINPSFLSSDSKRFLANISNTNYTCIHSTLGDYNIIGILPENEMFLNRNSNIVQVLLFNIVLFGVVFLLISILVQKIVINGIYKVNRSLRKITDGNLNIEIKVDSTQEFRNLSQGINSMVSSLKNAIEQANTRIDSELEFAQSIQLSSLPQNTNSYSASAYNEFDLYALMKTAKKVGGDFYYYFFKDKTHLCFFIGDVSGKGIPAALFMMTIPPLIRSYSETGYGAADIFNHVNRNLCKNSSSNMFVTIFLAILDTQTGELTYVNAGHNPPLLRKNNSQFEYMKIKPGLVLAALENMHYTEAKIFLESGDIIFLYTDGVTEAMNSKGELFSENRLKNSLNKMSFNISSKEIIQEMLIEIDKFTTNTNQTDDITMLALKYNGLSK